MGEKLAPTNPWRGIENSGEKNNSYSGMSNLRMYSTEALESCTLAKFAMVERSKLLNDPIGVFVCVDCWYDYSENQPISNFIDLAHAEDGKFNMEALQIFESIKEIK